MKMKTLLITTACLLGATGVASAQGIPTIDVANIIQTTTTAKNTLDQVTELKKAYETQLDELGEAVKQVDALTGNRGIGNLLNNQLDLELRRYTPETWQDTARILQAGGLPGSAADVRAFYEEISGSLNVADVGQINRVNQDAPNAVAYAQRRDTTFAAQAVAQASYNQTTQRVQDYERLMVEIENTPDTKAAADLANRIAAQNGITSSELIRLQTIALQQRAASDNQALVDATTNARLTQYESFALGEIPSQ